MSENTAQDILTVLSQIFEEFQKLNDILENRLNKPDPPSRIAAENLQKKMEEIHEGLNDE